MTTPSGSCRASLPRRAALLLVLPSSSILVHSFTGNSARSSSVRPYDSRLFVGLAQLPQVTPELSTNLPNARHESVGTHYTDPEKLIANARLCESREKVSHFPIYGG